LVAVFVFREIGPLSGRDLLNLPQLGRSPLDPTPLQLSNLNAPVSTPVTFQKLDKVGKY
jgi:hypothetical protein